MRNLDMDSEVVRIGNFISEYVHQSGFSGVVVGLSGGVDSALSAALAVKALGKEHVLGMMLPCKNSSLASFDDALLLANELGIHHERIDITPMVDSYFGNYQTDADNLRKGNWMARIRMCVLYDMSAKHQALVMGTSNYTELMVGYFTQHGDGACAFEPIGHLYKTEVWKLAEHLHVPERIIKKTPTADLWANQTDEGELGLTYNLLDEILYELTEGKFSLSDLIGKGYPAEQVQRVQTLMQKSAFKRKLPPLINDKILGK
jgi:NAD+ synthase